MYYSFLSIQFINFWYSHNCVFFFFCKLEQNIRKKVIHIKVVYKCGREMTWYNATFHVRNAFAISRLVSSLGAEIQSLLCASLSILTMTPDWVIFSSTRRDFVRAINSPEKLSFQIQFTVGRNVNGFLINFGKREITYYKTRPSPILYCSRRSLLQKTSNGRRID